MAQKATTAAPSTGLTDFAQPAGALLYTSGVDPDATEGEFWSAFDPGLIGQIDARPRFQVGTPAALTHVQFPALGSQKYGLGEPWFELIIAVPRSFNFGLILSAQTATLELYNADRVLAHTLLVFTNNTPGGVDVPDLPSLPHTIEDQRSLMLTVSVTVEGTFTVAGETLVFTFDVGDVAIPVTFSTIVLWGLAPEDGYTELLLFLTDVLQMSAGNEQRIGCRRNPRQLFDWSHAMDIGAEKAYYENLLFKHQAGTFGLPIWHEQTDLTVAVAIGNATITVKSTANADYRVGGLAIIFTSQVDFDVLTILSKTSTTITFASPSLNAYPVGTLVMPLRTALFISALQGGRYPVGLSTIDVVFEVQDNDVGSIASAAVAGTLLGKTIIEDFLGIRGTTAEGFDIDLFTQDNEVGRRFQDANWPRHRRTRPMTLLGSGKLWLWQHRQLMHYLDGRRVSFYLPTWLKDLVPILPLASGSAALHVSNVGFTNNVGASQPKGLIRVRFVDGSTPLYRTVVSSAEVSETQETLTLSTTWPSTIAVAAVEGIDFVELGRLDSDTVRIDHEPGFQFKRITAPFRSLIS